MTAQSPGAYIVSMLIHGAAVVLVLLVSYAAKNVVQDTPKVFELVAGAGDNYAARSAPALGSPRGVGIAAQKPESSPIKPAPLAPAQSKPLDMVAQLKRVEERREKRLEAQYQKEEEAERKKMTQEEFEKRQAAEKSGAKVSHIDAEGIRNGVIGGSTENKVGGAGGKALTREEGSELDAYFALLRARIKENLVPPEGVSDTLEARVEFFVAADGSLSQFRILKSSGNHEFDRSVIEACEHTTSIGARPDGQSEKVTMTMRIREDEDAQPGG